MHLPVPGKRKVSGQAGLPAVVQAMHSVKHWYSMCCQGMPVAGLTLSAFGSFRSGETGSLPQHDFLLSAAAPASAAAQSPPVA